MPPPRRRKQSNAMLYTLITFIGLFIASTTIAVIYYVKAEEHRTTLVELQNDLEDYANDRERQTGMGNIIGARPGNQSWLGTLTDYFDQAIVTIVGGVPEPTSAQVKVDNANTKVEEALTSVQEHIDIGDPNDRSGLVQIINELTAELEQTIKAKLDLQKQLDELQLRRKEADQANFEKEQELLAEKDKLQKQVDDIHADYEQLKVFLRQNTEQQVKTLMAQLEEATANQNELNDKLERTKAELTDAQKMMRLAQEQVMSIKPPPDPNKPAYKPDGKIILIDDQAKVVHLNIGSNEHVYPGLTFSVYDRGTLVSEDGKGKAEIKVFDVAETYSAARITKSEIKRPILQGDFVANLIWDGEKTNIFVVIGDFDLDKDGMFDFNATDKIKERIETWGGRVDDDVSINTDFIVIGEQPQLGSRPNLEDLEVDPMAMEKYEDSLQRLNHYNDVLSRAQALWIPVLRYDKFLDFIGYKSQIGQAGAF
jgi:hypothetical protein